MSHISMQGGYKPADTETVIKRAVIDALILRRELLGHDLTGQQRDQLMTAAMPALIALEVERVKGGR